MYIVNTAAASVRPTQKFLDWLMHISQKNGDDLSITLEQLRTNATVYLIPETDTPEENIAYIDEKYEEIFEAELSAWAMDENDYPQDRSLKAFWEFFDVEIHDMVVDLESEEDDELDEDDDE
ncbi:MAG: hypothetical protein IKN18_05550 [Neisseriaceae bacterium]|nr:hypothetical protein [Neisseriaceae bacterium]